MLLSAGRTATAIQLPQYVFHITRKLHISPSPITCAAQLPPRYVLKEEEITESFVHGSGPGGQKINKTACAVQLKHLPTGLTTLCQATRSRSQNRKIARRLLAERVEELEKGDESRVAIKGAMKSRKKASKTKKSRRKYKALEEGKKSAQEQEEEDEEEDGDVQHSHELAADSTSRKVTTPGA